MSYIGNTPTSQAFASGTDTFSGTGSQTAFTLSRNVVSPNDILVVVNNVEQQPSNYTVSGNTLTFSPAPSSGTNNIYVRFLSTNLVTIGVSDLSVSTTKIQDNAITTEKIAAGAVVPADLSTGGPSWTSGGVLSFNSGYGSVATAYGCRAWVNFNGTGTVAIRASGNVSSITDLGTGQYRVNFTTAMPDVNFCTLGFGIPQFDAAERTKLYSYTTSYTEIYNATMANTYYDSSQLMVAVFR
jgi:hypothetical protein